MAEQANYGVYIGYPKGYISEYNNAHSVMKNDKNQVITHFGGKNATEGQLGSGVQNSSQSKMEIPAKIEVMWLSFTENQFWHGEFELPQKELIQALTKEKILDLFTTRSGRKESKYSQIVVNVAPKGKVYVYLNGIPTKLIATYQAQPIQYDWLQHVKETWVVYDKNNIETQNEYVGVLTNYFKKLISQIDQNYKEDFFTPVRWKLNIKGDQKILAYTAKTLNGEYTQIFEKPTEQEIRSIPWRISVDIEEKGKVNRYSVRMNTMYEFYKQNFNNSELVEFIIDKPDEDNLFLYLKQGKKIVEFKDIRVQELDR